MLLGDTAQLHIIIKHIKMTIFREHFVDMHEDVW